MKLELKHIVGYLPYELGLYKENTFTKFYEMHLNSAGGTNRESISNVLDEHCGLIPILRPLSDLTKEIEVNGEKFVPIIELFAIAINVGSPKIQKVSFKEEKGFMQLVAKDNKKNDIVFAFDTNDNSFGTMYSRNTYSVFRQLELFEKLYEWHFDLHSLIEAGLAININTLK